MKVSREKTEPKFIPVTITLETQEEVDKMYAILNTSAIVMPLEINILSGCCWWEKLIPYRTEKGSAKWYNTLIEHLRAAYKQGDKYGQIWTK